MISVTSCSPPPTRLLLIFAEHAENAVDGLAGVDRVERGKDDVAGLGGGERHFHRLPVADFTDENRLGSLPQRGP